MGTLTLDSTKLSQQLSYFFNFFKTYLHFERKTYIKINYENIPLTNIQAVYVDLCKYLKINAVPFDDVE